MVWQKRQIYEAIALTTAMELQHFQEPASHQVTKHACMGSAKKQAKSLFAMNAPSLVSATLSLWPILWTSSSRGGRCG